MKKIILLFLLLLLIIFFSCKKEYSFEGGCSFKVVEKISKPNDQPVRIAFIGFIRSTGEQGYFYSYGAEFDSLVVDGNVSIGSCTYKINSTDFVDYGVGQIELVCLLIENGSSKVLYYPGSLDQYNNTIIGQFIKP